MPPCLTPLPPGLPPPPHTHRYQLEGNGFSIGDFNMIDGRWGLVIERDQREGDPAQACAPGAPATSQCFEAAAQFKRVYLVDMEAVGGVCVWGGVRGGGGRERLLRGRCTHGIGGPYGTPAPARPLSRRDRALGLARWGSEKIGFHAAPSLVCLLTRWLAGCTATVRAPPAAIHPVCCRPAWLLPPTPPRRAPRLTRSAPAAPPPPHSHTQVDGDGFVSKVAFIDLLDLKVGWAVRAVVRCSTGCGMCVGEGGGRGRIMPCQLRLCRPAPQSRKTWYAFLSVSLHDGLHTCGNTQTHSALAHTYHISDIYAACARCCAA